MRALGILGLLLHLLVVVIVGYAIVSAGFAFGDGIPGAEDVTSADQMHKLGDGYAWCFLGLIAVGILDVLLTVPAVIARYRHAWAFPAIGIGISILLCVVAVASFEVPPPEVGG